MSPARLEAFTDGVVAIIITIMVLELRPPRSTGWGALVPLWPLFLSYVLSFVNLGITGTTTITCCTSRRV